MPCINGPAPPAPPPLPSGVSIPVFTPPVIPETNLCCNITLPGIDVPAQAIPIAFPASVVATYAKLMKGIQAVFDAAAIPCPMQ